MALVIDVIWRQQVATTPPLLSSSYTIAHLTPDDHRFLFAVLAACLGSRQPQYCSYDYRLMTST
jgi:hypothetical protein